MSFIIPIAALLVVAAFFIWKNKDKIVAAAKKAEPSSGFPQTVTVKNPEPSSGSPASPAPYKVEPAASKPNPFVAYKAQGISLGYITGYIIHRGLTDEEKQQARDAGYEMGGALPA